MENNRVLTKHYPSLLDPIRSTEYYNYFRDTIQWEEGVKSRNGFTRLAKALAPGDNKLIDDILEVVLKTLKLEYHIVGIYLNYYKDGTHHTPTHSHKGLTQLVISLGASRILKISSKDYVMNNGDVIVFGSSAHSVPVSPGLQEGRISIATFMQPLYSLIPKTD